MLHIKVSADTPRDTECRRTCKSWGRSCRGIRHLAILMDDGSKVALLTGGNGRDRGIAAQTAIIIITGLRKLHKCHRTSYEGGKPTWMALVAFPQGI